METKTEFEETQLPDDLLPGNQEQALVALVSHASIKGAAEAAGISEATMWRYMRDAAFKKRLLRARREVFSDVVQRLQHNALHAAEMLREIAGDKSAPANARVSASRAILNLAMRGAEVMDLQARIDELEEALARRDEEQLLDQEGRGNQ